jgi:hypothetical protein
VIQRAWRKYCQEKLDRLKNHSAQQLQSHWRKNLAQKQSLRRLPSIIIVQRICRGYRSRKCKTFMLNTILRIQQMWRLLDGCPSIHP